MAVSNNSDTVQNFQVWNTGGDFVRYYVPAKSTVGIIYAAGNTSGSQAFRLLTVPGSASELSGYVSAAGIQRSNGLIQNVECLSCDEDGDTPAACQAIVPVP